MRVLVCGGRDYADRVRVNQVLTQIDAGDGYQHRITVIIEGEASGADTLAKKWAEMVGVTVEKYPADWQRYGRAAGPKRNAQMLAEGKPDLVVAFPGGRGTAHMIRSAEKAGVPVMKIP